MQILNNIHKHIGSRRLDEITTWVYREVGRPSVNTITYNHKTDNYKWEGEANIAKKEIRISIGKRILSMRYSRGVGEGKRVLIDPCGIEEIVVVAATHEMMHLKLRKSGHKQVYQKVHDVLKEWRRIHPSSKVKRFVFGVATYFLRKF